MKNRLNKLWSQIGCVVKDKLGPNRRVVNSNGQTVVAGGYQSELNYIMCKHPALLGAINV